MNRWRTGLVVAGVIALAMPALAHHAVQSQFDMNGKQQTWKGTLKEVRRHATALRWLSSNR